MEDTLKVTTNIQEIRTWVERFNGKPEVIDDMNAGSNIVTLRFNFPGKDDDRYLRDTVKRKELSWDEFQVRFEKQKLVFEYEDREKITDPSSSYRFLHRENMNLEEDHIL